MITEKDKALLAKKGISEEKFEHQLTCFATGFPFCALRLLQVSKRYFDS